MKRYTLKDLLKYHVGSHTEFQQDHFITGRASRTVYGQFKQALRELYKRVRGNTDFGYIKEGLEIDVMELSARTTANKYANTYDLMRDELQLKKKQRDLEEAKRSLEENKRELVRFWQQACVLMEKLEQEGPLTEDRLRDLDENMWVQRAKELMAIDFMVNNRITKSTLELIMCMPMYQRKNLIALTKNVPGLMEWFEKQGHGHFYQELGYLKPMLKKQITELLSQ